MAASSIRLTGNVVNDLEIKYSQNSTARLPFTIAVDHVWYDSEKTKQQETSFFDVISWGTLAERTSEVIEKGLQVTVVGRPEIQTYEDKEGNTQRRFQVVAADIAVNVWRIDGVSRRPKGEGAPAKSKPAPQKARADEEPF